MWAPEESATTCQDPWFPYEFLKLWASSHVTWLAKKKKEMSMHKYYKISILNSLCWLFKLQKCSLSRVCVCVSTCINLWRYYFCSFFILILFPFNSLIFFFFFCHSMQFVAEKAMAPHSSTPAWKIPWTEEPGRLQSMGLLESDTTERLHFHFSLSCIGEGNGNPLQCSCLENLRDGGAWWAAVYGVA